MNTTAANRTLIRHCGWLPYCRQAGAGFFVPATVPKRNSVLLLSNEQEGKDAFESSRKNKPVSKI